MVYTLPWLLPVYCLRNAALMLVNSPSAVTMMYFALIATASSAPIQPLKQNVHRTRMLVEQHVDAVAVVDKANMDLNFLMSWRQALKRFNVILILEHGLDPFKVTIPSWLVNYDMYSYDDIKKTFGGLTSDVVHFHGPSLRNFGLWISDKDYVLFIGADKPRLPSDLYNNHQQPPAQSLLPRRIIQDHLLNLHTPPSDKSFYNCIPRDNSRQQSSSQQQQQQQQRSIINKSAAAASSHRMSCQPQYPGLETYTGVSIAYQASYSLVDKKVKVKSSSSSGGDDDKKVKVKSSSAGDDDQDPMIPGAKIQSSVNHGNNTTMSIVAALYDHHHQQPPQQQPIRSWTGNDSKPQPSSTSSLSSLSSSTSVSIPINTSLNISAFDSIMVNRALLGLAMFYVPFPVDRSAHFFDTFEFANNMLRVTMTYTNIGGRSSSRHPPCSSSSSSFASSTTGRRSVHGGFAGSDDSGSNSKSIIGLPRINTSTTSLPAQRQTSGMKIVDKEVTNSSKTHADIPPVVAAAAAKARKEGGQAGQHNKNNRSNAAVAVKAGNYDDDASSSFMHIAEVSNFFRTVQLLDNPLSLSEPWSNSRRHLCPGRAYDTRYERYHQQIECAMLMLAKQVSSQLGEIKSRPRQIVVKVDGDGGNDDCGGKGRRKGKGGGGKAKKGEEIRQKQQQQQQQEVAQTKVFHQVEKSMQSWTYLWANRHWDGNNQNMWGHEKLFAVASRSSTGPKTSNTTCALLTMVHNEKDLLPLWLRYYTKTFDPRDIYIFDHYSDDNSTHPSKLPAGINYIVPFDLPRSAMPIFYRSYIVKRYQERLLHAGYKCVIFTDIDEFIVPKPKKYPGGLKEYLEKFVSDPNRLYHRVNGWEVGHVYYGNGSAGSGEPDFNWTDPYIFHQRKYYVSAPMYSKPILTKVPLQYRPGFHNLVDKGIAVSQDLDLVMLHMTSFDYKYCSYRAEVHYNQSQRMAKHDMDGGFATHWERYHFYQRKGLLCQYANGCYLGPMTATTRVMDNSGVFPMMLVPADFKDVQL